MPSRKELVAHGRDHNDIATAIGADLVIFQTLPDLVESVRHLNPTILDFDCSVFTGKYITGGVGEAYLEHIESLRSDNMRAKQIDAGLGALEGKANGGVIHGTAADRENEASTGASTPVKADDTVGLHNTFHTH